MTDRDVTRIFKKGVLTHVEDYIYMLLHVPNYEIKSVNLEDKSCK